MDDIVTRLRSIICLTAAGERTVSVALLQEAVNEIERLRFARSDGNPMRGAQGPGGYPTAAPYFYDASKPGAGNGGDKH